MAPLSASAVDDGGLSPDTAPWAIASTLAGIPECHLRRSASRTTQLDHPFGGEGHSYRSASTGLARATRSACPETVASEMTSASTLAATNTSGFVST